jgi:hypothetical protein
VEARHRRSHLGEEQAEGVPDPGAHGAVHPAVGVAAVDGLGLGRAPRVDRQRPMAGFRPNRAPSGKRISRSGRTVRTQADAVPEPCPVSSSADASCRGRELLSVIPSFRCQARMGVMVRGMPNAARMAPDTLSSVQVQDSPRGVIGFSIYSLDNFYSSLRPIGGNLMARKKAADMKDSCGIIPPAPTAESPSLRLCGARRMSPRPRRATPTPPQACGLRFVHAATLPRDAFLPGLSQVGAPGGPLAQLAHHRAARRSRCAVLPLARPPAPPAP